MGKPEYTPAERFRADTERGNRNPNAASLAAHWTAHSFLVRPGTRHVRKAVRLVGHDVLRARHLENRKQEVARFRKTRRSQ